MLLCTLRRIFAFTAFSYKFYYFLYDYLCLCIVLNLRVKHTRKCTVGNASKLIWTKIHSDIIHCDKTHRDTIHRALRQNSSAQVLLVRVLNTVRTTSVRVLVLVVVNCILGACPCMTSSRHALSRFLRVSVHSYERCSGTRSVTSSMVWACGLSPLLLLRRPVCSFGFCVFSVLQATSLNSKTTRELLASSRIRPRITILY